MNTQKQFKCSICTLGCTTRKGLKSHENIKHRGLRSICRYCDKRFSSNTTLDIHVNSFHKGIKYKCELCDKELSSARNRSSHVQAVHKGGKKYQCKSCDKEYKSMGALCNHSKSSHEGIRYNCEVCSYSATQQNDLRKHKISCNAKAKISKVSNVNSGWLGSFVIISFV